MAVPYISDGDAISYEKLNLLFGDLDSKLSTICNGKSFILAFNDGIPADLMGQCFFFVDPSQPSKWAHRCPGAKFQTGTSGIDPVTGLAKSNIADAVLHKYDHEVFTKAVAAAEVVSWDDANRIVTVKEFPVSAYSSGLGKALNTSLLDHSLEAHTLNRPDGTNRTYFIREETATHSERIHRYAVADIVMEGVSKVGWSEAWNKYSFLRFHNLNYSNGTIVIGGTHEPIAALGCVTFRKITTEGTEATEWERQDFNYFWKAKPKKDFRGYWYFASYFYQDAFGGKMIRGRDPDGAFPSNGMTANNVCNPSLIYDWVNALNYDDASFVANTKRYAWFYPDVHELKDEYSRYRSGALGTDAPYLADPGNAGSKLGDLVHHRGDVLLVKVHKTQKLSVGGVPTPYADVSYKKISFKGYGTIVADFAAENIAVTTHASGTLQLAKGAGDADWDYYLIPYGTNFFKTGESFETIIALSSVPRALEASVLDDQNPFVPQFTNWLQVISTRSIVTAPNTRSYQQEDTLQTIQVAGPDLRTLQSTAPPASGRTIITAPQNVTVADLLALNMFGDKNLASQNTQWTTYGDVQLVLTPFGLVLKFVERVPFDVMQTADLASAATLGWRRAEDSTPYLERKRIIKFRGHGFGWADNGRDNSMFFSCRKGRRIHGTGYQNNVKGPDGVDFKFPLPINGRETLVKCMRRVQPTWLKNGERSGRFWQLDIGGSGTNPMGVSLGDAFLAVDEKVLQRGDNDEYARLWISANLPQLISNRSDGLGGGAAIYGLLPEHYNGMAQVVNSLKEGKALDFRCLRWVVTYQDKTYSVGIDLQHDSRAPGLWAGAGPGGPLANNTPVPVDCFDYAFPDSAADVQRRFAFYEQAGLPIYGERDLPGWIDGLGNPGLPNVRNKDRKTTVNVSVVVSNTDGYPGLVGYVPADGHTVTTVTGQQVEWLFSTVDISFNFASTYPESARPTGTAFFPLYGFQRLQNIYAGIRWVKARDVSEWLQAYSGFTATFDEFFIPYELRVVKQGTAAKPGTYHKNRVVYQNKPTFQEIFAGLTGPPPNGHPTRPGADGTYNYSFDLAESDVEVLAFYPAEDESKAQWKLPAGTGFVIDGSDIAFVPNLWIRNIRFWNGFSPAGLFSAITPHFWVDPIGGDGKGVPTVDANALRGQVTTAPNGYAAFWDPRGYADNGQSYVQGAEGPWLHIEWDGDKNDDTAKAEHLRWLRLNYGIFYSTLGFRSASEEGSPVETSPIVFVHRGFWAEGMNYWHDRIERLQRSRFQSVSGYSVFHNPPAFKPLEDSRSTGWLNPNFSGENPWVWREKDALQNTWGPATITPAINGGVNVFTAPAPDETNENYGLEYKGLVVSAWTRVNLD